MNIVYIPWMACYLQYIISVYYFTSIEYLLKMYTNRGYISTNEYKYCIYITYAFVLVPLSLLHFSATNGEFTVFAFTFYIFLALLECELGRTCSVVCILYRNVMTDGKKREFFAIRVSFPPYSHHPHTFPHITLLLQGA